MTTTNHGSDVPSLVPARLPASEPPSGEAAAIVARLRPDGAESASLAAAHADSLAALRAEVERLSAERAYSRAEVLDLMWWALRPFAFQLTTSPGFRADREAHHREQFAKELDRRAAAPGR